MCSTLFFEASLRAGNWDPGVVRFFTFSLPNFPTHLTLTFLVITHLLAHPNLPPESTHPVDPSCINPCTLSLPVTQPLAPQPVCLLQDFWVWGGWVLLVVCLWGGALIKEYTGDYVNRWVLYVCWFLRFSSWAIRASFNLILFPSSTLTTSLAMFQ